MKKFIAALVILSSSAVFAYIIEPAGSLYKVRCNNGTFLGYASTLAEAQTLGTNKCGKGNFNVTTGIITLEAEKQVK